MIDVFELVHNLVLEAHGDKSEKITDNTHLRKDLYFDGMDITSILFSLEKRLEIPMFAEPEDVNTVGDIVRAASEAYKHKQGEKQPVLNTKQTEAHAHAQDVKPQKISFDQVALYNIRNEKFYCKITGRQCKKLNMPANPTACKQAKCKIANNLYKIVTEAQNIK